jgi:hypothetical protein
MSKFKTTAHPFDLLVGRFAEVFAERLKDVFGRAQPAHAPVPRNLANAKMAVSGGRKKGAKRSPALIAKTTGALLAHIKAHNGQRIEQIAAAMNVSTNDLKLPASKLLAEKKVKTKGQKRGTQYFAA